MERMRTWTSIHSSQRYIYIYLCMYIIVTCLTFTRNFEKRIFERRKSAIGSKNNRNLPRVNKCDIILYIYVYLSVCLSIFIGEAGISKSSSVAMICALCSSLCDRCCAAVACPLSTRSACAPAWDTRYHSTRSRETIRLAKKKKRNFKKNKKKK